ncbi:MAG: NAD(P)-dependent oxidoreductase [Planctomycetota bacterium]|nr:NAD(P)-dependent oxidoreductase [Planctomycetota bacterium]
MKIALTGGTGFIGRYIIDHLVQSGHSLRCWYRNALTRPTTCESVEWIEGDLQSGESSAALVAGCDAIIHNAFWKPGVRFQGEEGDIVQFVQTNVIGSLKLIEAAIAAGLGKFVFVSSCSVHEKILSDRELDEAHPLWPTSHYGAHKAAIENFIHSYGRGHGFDICAIRPTGVYGLHHTAPHSKWYDLIQRVVNGEDVECRKGGKEVHAADVARSIQLLLGQAGTAGEIYACYDRYVSQYEVASLAREICGSNARIDGEPTLPRHEINASKIRGLGMHFGGDDRLRQTIEQIIKSISCVN